ncbi:MAG: DNA/RNA non-specific endonuclease [Acidobacteriota bacterium]
MKNHRRTYARARARAARMLAVLMLPFLLAAQEFDYLPVSANKDIIRHSYYTLSFVDKYKEAEWVAYRLTDYMTQGSARRSNKFKPDPLLKEASPTPLDYRRTGYDKGHLCPAADMKWSASAMDETFYMSNMTPQVPGFNRGIWKKLEDQVREWAVDLRDVYVVTGAVLQDSLATIGKRNAVSVPKYFYKIVMEYHDHEKKAIAFLLPNESSDAPIAAYAVPIDSIETLTKINFFPSLSDSLESKLESSVNISDWNFIYPNQLLGQ